MPFDPCGHVVDFLDQAVIDEIHPFRDSDIVVKRKWYPAAPGAPALPFPTAFQSRHGQALKWIPSPIGELWNSSIEYIKPVVLTGFTYQHICGTADDFYNGAKFNPDLPPVARDRDGIPLCCERNVDCAAIECTQEPFNGAPASQLIQYAIDAADATDTTPVVMQMVAEAVGGSPAFLPGTIEGWWPAGIAADAGWSATQFADTSQVPVERVEVFKIDANNFTQTVYDVDGYAITVSVAGVVGTLSLALVAGVVQLVGTGVELAPSMLPGGLLEWDTTAAAAAGNSQGTATLLSGTAVTVSGADGTKGVRLPADGNMVVVFNAAAFPGPNLFVYPPSGERIGMGATNIAHILPGGNVTNYIRVSATRWATFAGAAM